MLDEVIHIPEDEVIWDITEAAEGGDDGSAPAPSSEKHPFVQLLPISDDMADGQKEFARLFNSMRDMLMNNGMMKKK